MNDWVLWLGWGCTCTMAVILGWLYLKLGFYVEGLRQWKARERDWEAAAKGAEAEHAFVMKEFTKLKDQITERTTLTENTLREKERELEKLRNQLTLAKDATVVAERAKDQAKNEHCRIADELRRVAEKLEIAGAKINELEDSLGLSEAIRGNQRKILVGLRRKLDGYRGIFVDYQKAYEKLCGVQLNMKTAYNKAEVLLCNTEGEDCDEPEGEKCAATAETVGTVDAGATTGTGRDADADTGADCGSGGDGGCPAEEED